MVKNLEPFNGTCNQFERSQYSAQTNEPNTCMYDCTCVCVCVCPSAAHGTVDPNQNSSLHANRFKISLSHLAVAREKEREREGWESSYLLMLPRELSECCESHRAKAAHRHAEINSSAIFKENLSLWVGWFLETTK